MFRKKKSEDRTNASSPSHPAAVQPKLSPAATASNTLPASAATTTVNINTTHTNTNSGSDKNAKAKNNNAVNTAHAPSMMNNTKRRMRTKNKLDIRIDLEKDVFIPGDTIRGKVIVKVKKRVEIKNIKLKFVGREKAKRSMLTETALRKQSSAGSVRKGSASVIGGAASTVGGTNNNNNNNKISVNYNNIKNYYKDSFTHFQQSFTLLGPIKGEAGEGEEDETEMNFDNTVSSFATPAHGRELSGASTPSGTWSAFTASVSNMKKKRGVWLEPGDYTFPFELELPTDIPPSYYFKINDGTRTEKLKKHHGGSATCYYYFLATVTKKTTVKTKIKNKIYNVTSNTSTPTTNPVLTSTANKNNADNNTNNTKSVSPKRSLSTSRRDSAESVEMNYNNDNDNGMQESKLKKKRRLVTVLSTVELPQYYKNKNVVFNGVSQLSKVYKWKGLLSRNKSDSSNNLIETKVQCTPTLLLLQGYVENLYNLNLDPQLQALQPGNVNNSIGKREQAGIVMDVNPAGPAHYNHETSGSGAMSGTSVNAVSSNTNLLLFQEDDDEEDEEEEEDVVTLPPNAGHRRRHARGSSSGNVASSNTSTRASKSVHKDPYNNRRKRKNESSSNEDEDDDEEEEESSSSISVTSNTSVFNDEDGLGSDVERKEGEGGKKDQDSEYPLDATSRANLREESVYLDSAGNSIRLEQSAALEGMIQGSPGRELSSAVTGGPITFAAPPPSTREKKDSLSGTFTGGEEHTEDREEKKEENPQNENSAEAINVADPPPLATFTPSVSLSPTLGGVTPPEGNSGRGSLSLGNSEREVVYTVEGEEETPARRGQRRRNRSQEKKALQRAMTNDMLPDTTDRAQNEAAASSMREGESLNSTQRRRSRPSYSATNTSILNSDKPLEGKILHVYYNKMPTEPLQFPIDPALQRAGRSTTSEEQARSSTTTAPTSSSDLNHSNPNNHNANVINMNIDNNLLRMRILLKNNTKKKNIRRVLISLKLSKKITVKSTSSVTETITLSHLLLTTSSILQYCARKGIDTSTLPSAAAPLQAVSSGGQAGATNLSWRERHKIKKEEKKEKKRREQMEKKMIKKQEQAVVRQQSRLEEGIIRSAEESEGSESEDESDSDDSDAEDGVVVPPNSFLVVDVELPVRREMQLYKRTSRKHRTNQSSNGSGGSSSEAVRRLAVPTMQTPFTCIHTILEVEFPKNKNKIKPHYMRENCVQIASWVNTNNNNNNNNNNTNKPNSKNSSSTSGNFRTAPMPPVYGNTAGPHNSNNNNVNLNQANLNNMNLGTSMRSNHSHHFSI